MNITKMPLNRFIEALLPPLQDKLEEKQPALGVTISTSMPSAYVTPTISVEQNGTPNSAPLLLISAAGAMGKSMASMAIASQLKCPRLDLSQTIVGQNSHSGILASALKISSFARYTELLNNGEASLVIDALDEAPLRSGDRAFFAFMESLAVEANSLAVKAHQIVVLGRPQNIELFSDLCEDLGVPTTVARIDSLALPSALELIDQILLATSPSNASHRTHPVPAREYWEAYLVGLGEQLSSDPDFSAKDWDLVSDFLGYPPVLAALAPILEQANYISALQDHHTEHQGSGERSGILLRIVDNLLARESNKVQSALRQELDQLDERIIHALYTHDEQISRILSHLGVPTSIPLPASLPEELRPAYEDRIGAFVSDHPFLDGGSSSKARNIVFSDYLRALVDSKVSYVNVVSESRLDGRGLWNVGPFYAYFMHAIALQANDHATSAFLLNEDYVNEIVRSWVASAAPNTRGSASYHHENDDAPTLLLTLEDQSGHHIDGLDFTVSEPTGVLTLDSPIYGSSELRV